MRSQPGIAIPLLFVLVAGLSGCAAGNRVARGRVSETGVASYYADRFDGRRTASGEVYRASALTAAHPSLPFGTRVRVTNLENDRSVVVVVNDRGPFKRGRVVDLSRRAARELEFLGPGTTRVRLEVVGR